LKLAVFDLDGTITRRDTLAGFVFGYVRGHPRRAWRMGVVPLAAAAFFLDGRDRGRLKARLVRGVLGGLRRADLAPWTGAYIEKVMREELCPGAVARLAAHRAAGDHLVLLSASIDLYVPELGQRLGFAETICTQVRWTGERLDGSLLTPNRRGEEKVRCLEAIRSRFPGIECCAYGNDAADLAHLRRVEHGVLVNGNEQARRRAAALGIRCERWC
jgi:HAD superfamily hydrolase (TIGR01490 family)